MAMPKKKARGAKGAKANRAGQDTQSPARALHKRCGLPEQYCRAAIRKYGDDVDGVLAILIAAGDV